MHHDNLVNPSNLEAGDFVVINDQYCDVFGFDPEMLGGSTFVIVDIDSRRIFINVLDDELDTHKVEIPIEAVNFFVKNEHVLDPGSLVQLTSEGAQRLNSREQEPGVHYSENEEILVFRKVFGLVYVGTKETDRDTFFHFDLTEVRFKYVN